MREGIQSLSQFSTAIAYVGGQRAIQTSDEMPSLIEMSQSVVTEHNYHRYAAAAMGGPVAGLDREFVDALPAGGERGQLHPKTLELLAYLYAKFDETTVFPGIGETMSHEHVLKLMAADSGFGGVHAITPDDYFAGVRRVDRGGEHFKLLFPDDTEQDVVRHEIRDDAFEPIDAPMSHRQTIEVMRSISIVLQERANDDGLTTQAGYWALFPMAQTMSTLIRYPDVLKEQLQQVAGLAEARDENGLTLLHHSALVKADDVHHDKIMESLDLLLQSEGVEFRKAVHEKESLMRFVVREVASERVLDRFMASARRLKFDLNGKIDESGTSILDAIVQSHQKDMSGTAATTGPAGMATTLARDKLVEAAVRHYPAIVYAGQEAPGKSLLALLMQFSEHDADFASARAVLRLYPDADIEFYPGDEASSRLAATTKKYLNTPGRGLAMLESLGQLQKRLESYPRDQQKASA